VGPQAPLCWPQSPASQQKCKELKSCSSVPPSEVPSSIGHLPDICELTQSLSQSLVKLGNLTAASMSASLCADSPWGIW
jgi:hypothetical protein